MQQDSEEKQEQHQLLLEEIRQAIEALERLIKTGASIERLTMLGAAYKRKAYMADTSKERHSALEHMADNYRRAYDRDCAESTTATRS